jgi:hypothetical protein
LAGCVLNRCPSKDEYTDGLLTKLSRLLYSSEGWPINQSILLVCSAIINCDETRCTKDLTVIILQM